jgi:hypothetical protein
MLPVIGRMFETYRNFLDGCNTESDIHEHLPTLFRFASKCDTVVEFGVRFGTSSRALIAARPESLISYDTTVEPEAEALFAAGRAEGLNCQLIEKSSFDIELELTEFLFIDSDHSYDCLTKELKLHADRVTRFIAFHDTVSYGRELMPAIDEFLKEHPEWQPLEVYDNNNGFIVIHRVA